MQDEEKLLENYFDRLWPICRSITGNGLRQSLSVLSEIIPLEIQEVPSGTMVFDWEIPKEWNITDAYILTPEGQKICDFKTNNLHVLNYSIPVDREITFEELDRHLHSLPDLPDAIPYLTSYYSEKWGFCISHREREQLNRNGLYRVKIDSILAPGSLTYGQCVLPGESKQEILLSTYLCHPSLANNELSGPLVTAFLYKKLAALKSRRFTYRFLFAPETIGVIAFLARTGAHLKENLHAGYVVTCVGDAGSFTYKRSKDPARNVDRAAEHVLGRSGRDHKVLSFSIGGSDERQYCSPGFNFPVGSLMRTMYQRYKEYHTSLDNKNIISFTAMLETVNMYFDITQVLEWNRKYINTVPFCEPQLGKRGLYPEVGGQKQRAAELSRRLHLLSWADGNADLIEIAERAGEHALLFVPVIQELNAKGLLETENDQISR